MTEKVVRYHCEMEGYAHGEWVRYSDYKALEMELNLTLYRNKRLREALEGLHAVPYEIDCPMCAALKETE